MSFRQAKFHFSGLENVNEGITVYRGVGKIKAICSKYWGTEMSKTERPSLPLGLKGGSGRRSKVAGAMEEDPWQQLELRGGSQQLRQIRIQRRWEIQKYFKNFMN